jgi:hypothetical protein
MHERACCAAAGRLGFYLHLNATVLLASPSPIIYRLPDQAPLRAAAAGDLPTLVSLAWVALVFKVGILTIPIQSNRAWRGRPSRTLPARLTASVPARQASPASMHARSLLLHAAVLAQLRCSADPIQRAAVHAATAV